MTAAGVYHLNLLPLAFGLAIFAVCVFVAGWVVRGEYDLYQRATGRAQQRRTRAARRPPSASRLRW